jgi:hypothetical protein
MQLNDIQDITDSLALMPDPALQQYAQMHKDDPYVMSLAMSESNRRKKLRAAQQGQAGQMPQPKVVDQAIAAMNAPPPQQMPPQQPAPQGAPQGQGIAQLPTPNLQGMADGGIAGYDDEEDVQGMARGGNAGSDPKAAYRQYALSQAAKLGLDPSVVDSIFKIESNYNPDAQSPTGPVGIGQLTKQTGKAYGAAGEDRKDPYKNIDASLAYMADLKKKYGNDPEKIAVAYNQGESVLNKHLRQNNGEINQAKLPSEAQGYLKKLSTMLTAAVPIGTAQAAEAAPAQKGEGANAGIAALGGAAAGAGVGASGMSMGDKLNQVLRPSSRLGVAAPGMGAAAGVGAIGAGLSAGAANALSNATPEQLEQLQGDIGSDTGLAAAIMNPRNRGEEVTKAQMPYGQQMANVGKTLVGHPDIYNKPAQEAQAPTGGEGIGSQADRDLLMHMERGQQNAASAPEAKDIIAAAKETADPEVSKGWTKDDWLTFGLAALATESPNFLQGIGQAGLATQKQRQARTQQESSQELTKAQIKKLNADTDYLNEQKGQNALRMKALSLASADFEKWMASAGLASTPEEQDAARKKITGYYMQQMGVTPATMGGTGIAGFKFLGAES